MKLSPHSMVQVENSSQQTPETSQNELRDPVLACLVLCAKLNAREVHAATLKSGFALDAQGRVPLTAYPDVARMHGLTAVWSKMNLPNVPSYVLPVVLPLSDGRCCVLLGFEKAEARILLPETGLSELRMQTSLLKTLSDGDMLVVKNSPQKTAQQMVPFTGEAFSWFWGTLWRFKRFYAESMLASVVANLLTLATIFFTMNVYDRVVPTQAYTSLWTLAIGTSIAIGLEFLMRWLKARLADLGGKKADVAINSALLREIMEIRLEHRPQSIGIFASSMRDFEALRDFLSSASLVLVADLPFIVVFLGLIAVIGGPLVFIPLAVVPLLLLTGLWAQRPLMKAMRSNMKESGDKQSVLVETLMNLELLKAHNAQSYLQRRWENANQATSDSYQKIRSLSNLMLGLTSTAQQLVTVGLVVLGVYLIGDNRLTLGGLIAAVILAGRAISPLGQVMALAARYQQARTSLQTLDGLMKRPRDRYAEHRYLAPSVLDGRLGATQLAFTYPGEHKKNVIQNISFQMAGGDHLALLGRIGSGKSTLLRLMSGLYKPTSGMVLIDDMDLQQIEPSELRSRIGYVGQEAQLFMGSLRENLVLSDSWISDAMLMDVLQKLDLHTLVASHPRGLDMPLTEAGGGLSGGQRQLLAVARMILRDPVYVFMDEPTSLMDQNTEAKVIAVLDQWLSGRTLILATHRLQLLQWVNRIALLDRGHVLAQGPKEEMLKQLRTGISAAASAEPSPVKEHS
jgi:ATP-binding cassette subfamily C protein LapB